MNIMKKEEIGKFYSNNKPVINSSLSACEKSQNNPIIEKLEIDPKIKFI
jgi:hypothetical protein